MSVGLERGAQPVVQNEAGSTVADVRAQRERADERLGLNREQLAIFEGNALRMLDPKDLADQGVG
jgi:hypothetical protein